MALPKLNDVPKYELVIPSTKKHITYRPFLVKEQKVLLIALESQDDKQILNAIVDVIDACLYDKLNIRSLATFDLEYIFTQIRAKSVGETSTVNILCKSCEEPNPITIDLSKVEVENTVSEKLVKLNENYTLKLSVPKYEKVISRQIGNNNNIADTLYGTVMMCMDALLTEDEQLKFDDETTEEITSFLESLTSEQFQHILDFVNEMPQIKHDVDFKCESCGHDNQVTLKGLQDFF